MARRVERARRIAAPHALPLQGMRIRRAPRTRALPRLRPVGLAVRSDSSYARPGARRIRAACRPFAVVARRALAARRGVPAAERIERADPEPPDARADGRWLCVGRPYMQGRSCLPRCRYAGSCRDRIRPACRERAGAAGIADARFSVSFARRNAATGGHPAARRRERQPTGRQDAGCASRTVDARTRPDTRRRGSRVGLERQARCRTSHAPDSAREPAYAPLAAQPVGQRRGRETLSRPLSARSAPSHPTMRVSEPPVTKRRLYRDECWRRYRHPIHNENGRPVSGAARFFQRVANERRRIMPPATRAGR